MINFLTNFERNYTTTNRQTSLAIKSILAQMVNSILIPVIVAQYIKKDLYKTSGLVDNIFMMSITGALVGPVLVFFDPLNIFTKLLRCLKSTLPSANQALFFTQALTCLLLFTYNVKLFFSLALAFCIFRFLHTDDVVPIGVAVAE